MSPHMEDYYAVLGIVSTASVKEIKAAFQQLAKQLHPDHNPRADATKVFQLVSLSAVPRHFFTNCPGALADRT
jgi:DnaJ-class molecular chaperone